jgi:prepilin-type N-terminal cleavage/methylation domain-containing protein
VLNRRRDVHAAARERRARAGLSLVELLVALSLGGIVLGVAAGSMLRQQRAVRWVEGLSGAELQLRPVLQLLAEELSQLDASGGDLAPGQASDSSLQLRAVVAASLSCDSASALTLLPERATAPALAGSTRPPDVGDSVWLYRGASLGWRARAVTAVSRTTSACAVPTSPAGPTYRLLLDAPPDVAAGTPVRVTRWERWVVYRAGDGKWYVGIRDYSPSTARFLATQPVAGPFLRAARSGARTGFRYFDASGTSVDPDGTNEARIARVRISVLSVVPSIGADGVRSDSADAVLSRAGAP